MIELKESEAVRTEIEEETAEGKIMQGYFKRKRPAELRDVCVLVLKL